MEKLNKGLPRLGSEPFITRLEPGASSGKTLVVFPGREFIYCLEGHITYTSMVSPIHSHREIA